MPSGASPAARGIRRRGMDPGDAPTLFGCFEQKTEQSLAEGIDCRRRIPGGLAAPGAQIRIVRFRGYLDAIARSGARWGAR